MIKKFFNNTKLIKYQDNLIGFSDSIAVKEYFIKDSVFNIETILQLKEVALNLKQAGKLNPANIGRLDSLQNLSTIRGDETSWIENWGESPLNEVQELFKIIIDKAKYELFQSVKRFESHFSHYPPGTLYERHKDQHVNQKSRILSAVLYLGKWEEGDGGELYLYPEDTKKVKISPIQGRLVVFKSEIAHEVVVTKSDRWSIASWIRND